MILQLVLPVNSPGHISLCKNRNSVPKNAKSLTRRAGVVLLSSAIAWGLLPQPAQAAPVTATSLIGSIKNAVGQPLAEKTLTISVDTWANEQVTPVEVGWGYSWSDGSFDSWIGYPEVIAAETDIDGEFPVDITIPGDTGAPTAVYSGLAKVDSTGAVRPYDEETGKLGTFDLKLINYNDGTSPTVADLAASPIVTTLSTTQPGATIKHDGETVGVNLQSNKVAPASSDPTATTFKNVAPATDAEVRSVTGGAQLLSVMQNSSASTSQKYNLTLPTGVKLTSQDDGGYVMVDEAGEAVGRIDAPWAKDATGKDLPTQYTLSGNVLTQTTNTAGATFPVVADPKVSFGIRVYVRYSRAEVKAMKQQNVLVGGASLATAVCGKIPVFWLKVACGAAIAIASNSVNGTFKDAANRDRCVELKFNYQGILMEWTTRARGSWCK